MSGQEQVLRALRALTTDNNYIASRAEIAAYIREQFGTAVPNSSITTYLGRLRRRGEAELQGNKWYAP
jgi:hypothetical protein